VHDVNTSNSAATWDCIVTRIHELNGKWLFAGNGTLLDRSLLDAAREQIELESTEAGITAGEYVRSRSHEWRRRIERLHADRLAGLRIVNFEGDPIEFSTAEYEVTDESRVAGALAPLEMFDETTSHDDQPGVRRFAWIETGPGGDDGRRSYGSIEIAGGKLRLSSNSRRRLGIGRQLVEKHGGEFVRHLGDTFESVDDLKRRALEQPQPAPAPKPIDPEIERKLIEKVKSEHYARWVDEPVPALNGQTPREAVKSEVGRRAVEDLLRGLENREERERRKGRAAFDCSQLRRSLGL
jgi:hypothetical protein